LTAALQPVGSHPILVVTGEQGAAATTMLRVCRRLIDPNASPVRAHAKELRNRMIAARKNWLVVYDNITTLPTWLSNGLFVRSYTDEQNRFDLAIKSIPKTGMTGTSKQGSRRSHGAGRRSHGAEPHFELSMQAI
jgi:ABC-type transport system involved in cytochrome c biogenesis ATPase subunit